MSFKHILFPIDFSENSHALNADVEWLANRFQSRVTLLHVFEMPLTWYAASEATFVNFGCLNDVADGMKERLDAWEIHVPSAHVHRIQVEGRPAPEIIDWACEHDVDLIAMGTQGHSRVGGLLTGSVLERIMHETSIPVWTRSLNQCEGVTPGHGVKTILCAVGISEEAYPVIKFAEHLADSFAASVFLLHSIPGASVCAEYDHDGALRRQYRELARDEILSLQRQASTDFTVLIGNATISDAVTQEAWDRQADLIVIGRGKSQQALGSLRTHIYDIVRQAPCPVLSYSPEQEVTIPSLVANHLAQSVTS